MYLGTHTYIHTYTHIYRCVYVKDAIILKESRSWVHGRVWIEERERGNDIISKIKNLKKLHWKQKTNKQKLGMGAFTCNLKIERQRQVDLRIKLASKPSQSIKFQLCACNIYVRILYMFTQQNRTKQANKYGVYCEKYTNQWIR